MLSSLGHFPDWGGCFSENAAGVFSPKRLLKPSHLLWCLLYCGKPSSFAEPNNRGATVLWPPLQQLCQLSATPVSRIQQSEKVCGSKDSTNPRKRESPGPKLVEVHVLLGHPSLV